MISKTVINNHRTRKLPKIILGQLLFAVATCALASGIIFYAQGFRINWQTGKILHTGLLYLDYMPKNATLSVNGRQEKCSSPCAISKTPGFYRLTIAQSGLDSWAASVAVDSSSINSWKNIILFKNEIKPVALTDQTAINLLNSPVDTLAQNATNDLKYNDYEIWLGSSLVTRLSTPIQHVIWYPDYNHVVYQQGSEIRIIETSGLNDTLLVTLESKNPSQFVIAGRGELLYYADGGKYYTAKIR